MRTRCLLSLVGAVALAALVVQPRAVMAQENPVSLDPNKGTRNGSPVDDLPPHIRLLDIDLPDGGKPMRADWSPDGRRLVFLDAPIGDVWEHRLGTRTTRNLTATFLPAGVLRAHHLSNGDLVLCALDQRSADDPAGDRFRGRLWVLQRPLGKRPPVPLEESCWEGIAVSKQPGSTRIAWNQSSIDFTEFPNVFVEALVGQSQVLTGRIVYGTDGVPTIADRTVVLDKRDVSPDTPAVEAQDFRSLDDGDADPDDELIFTAYSTRGGQAMGVNLDTGAVTDYAPTSPYYEEAEGVDPAGGFVLVERDLTITLFPGMVDIWRLKLDGSGTFERLTTFNYYRGFGANNPVVSPDGTLVAFGLKVEGEEGEGDGILLLDLTASAAGPSGPGAAPGAIDYLHAPFQTRRVLDWGDRPNWSPNGRRLVFTESDTEDGFAYELDLDTGGVRCLTCRWGPSGLVTRIYHLPDGSYLIEAAPSRETSSSEAAGGGPAGLLTTELYWMPASAAMPPQPLAVPAAGEVAISTRTASGGGFLIAWSSPFTLGQIMTGELFHDGSRAAVTNRRTIPTQLPQADGPLGGYGEPYDFARNAQALVFWGFAAPLDGEMFEVDLETGAVQRLYRDPSHNETHLFPDERFGLEESNRASDPNGPLRGVSGLAGAFDLFVVAFDGPRQIRRLTDVSDLGGQANQSVPAPDGRRIAFALDAPSSGPYAGKGGLYVGEFLIDRCAKDGQRRVVPRTCRQ